VEAPVIQGTTVELIHQPEDGEGARIIAAAVAARLRRRDRIAMQFVAVHESNDPTRHSVGSVGISHRRVDLGLMRIRYIYPKAVQED
jgi:hypothetical protein